MKTPNYYYNKESRLLVMLNDELKPVAGFSGNIARRKYAELKRQRSYTDIRTELELCKSVLLSNSNLPDDIRADYQRKYRQLKKAMEQTQNQLLTHKN